VLLSYHGSLHLDAIRSGIEHSMPNDCNLVLNRNILDNLAHERNILENLDISRTRVLIAAPSYQDEADNTEAYGQLLRQGLPLLIIDHSLPNLPADEISFDEYNATAELTREALIRAKERPVAMFCLNQPTDRISKIRCQAMLDVWQEFGGNSANRRLYMIQCLSWEHAKQSMQMMRAYCSDQFQANVVLFPSTPVAWEFFKAMRELGKTNGIQQISGIGDILRGDDDFNRRLYAHYRLFDEFTPLIKEVLRARLSGEEAPSVPIRRTIGFKPMNSIQIHHYFTERFA
jgi:DNA-binding LacI/PurR family transcriptional regulator